MMMIFSREQEAQDQPAASTSKSTHHRKDAALAQYLKHLNHEKVIVLVIIGFQLIVRRLES